MRRAREAGVPVALALLLGLLGLLHVAVLAYHLALTAGFPYDLDYGEGYVLNDAVRLAHGEPLYVDIRQFPMVRSPYPPLFPAVWARLVPLAGPAFWPGRALSCLAVAGICALAAWSGRRAGVGRWPALVAPAAIAASPFVYQWGAYARVDLLALLFAAGGVAVAQWVGGWRGLVLAAALCTLGLWTKQSAVAAPAAIALALGARRWRRAAAFVALLAAPTLLAGAALEARTAGQFSRHVVLGNAQNPFYPERMAAYLLIFLLLHLPLVAAAGWWAARSMRGSPSPIALYVPLALLAALSVGNAGSSVNYLLEPVVACALAVPFAWRALPSPAAPLAPLLAAVQLATLAHWPNGVGVDYLGVAPHGRTPTAADYAAGAAVDAAMRDEPGPVLAEPAGFAVRNGRPVYVQPIDLRAEQRLGRWDSARLVAALAEGRFGLVVAAYNLFPADVEQAIAEHFGPPRLVAGEDDLTFGLYRYRGPPGAGG